MAVRANTYRVNVICILILTMIWFPYIKRLNEVKTDGLNTEEVYRLFTQRKEFWLIAYESSKIT